MCNIHKGENLMPVIRVSDTLYARLGNLAVGFDTPANVIENLLNQYDGVTPMQITSAPSTNKITLEIIEKAYHLSKDVYEQKLSIANAQSTLVNELNMHAGSARDYISNFQEMMAGECYKRTMNGLATEHYLKRIQSDFGKKNLENALNSVLLHIEYYEQFSNGKLRNIRKIHEEFSRII
jgi:hypothetical protein